MGVKFGREYEDIVKDLTAAIAQIDDCYQFFEMSKNDWLQLNHKEQTECITTLADDVFFALGTSSDVHVGSGTLQYLPHKHVITVAQPNNQVTIVNLV